MADTEAPAQAEEAAAEDEANTKTEAEAEDTGAGNGAGTSADKEATEAQILLEERETVSEAVQCSARLLVLLVTRGFGGYVSRFVSGFVS